MKVLSLGVKVEQPETIYLNMNKIMKQVKSKHGIEGARRYEENVRLADFWHPKDVAAVKKAADNTLINYINKMFDGLSEYEKVTIVQQIQYNVLQKLNQAIKKLDNKKFYNVGKAGDEVLKCAMERDRHLDIVEGVLNEVKARGQKTLNSEQKRVVEQEMKAAQAFEEKRKEYAIAREDANEKNYEIAEGFGPDVYKAYVYLHGEKPKAKK